MCVEVKKSGARASKFAGTEHKVQGLHRGPARSPRARAQGIADADLIQTGRFGAMMDVSSVNDGPVTFIFDADAAAPPPEVRCTPPA